MMRKVRTQDRRSAPFGASHPDVGLDEFPPAARHLARALRRWRLLNRVKQTHAAEILGVTQGTISRWEAGSLGMDSAQVAAVNRLVAARLDSAADRALMRLVSTSEKMLHLIDDLTHVLLVASPSRHAEFSGAPNGILGRSLWPFATREIVDAEARLENLGWFELNAPPDHEFETGGNGFEIVRITAGRCRWTRMTLSDGAAVRLVETLETAG